MSGLSRRDIIRWGAALATGFGLDRGVGRVLASGLQQVVGGQQRVIWLQGMSCTGCSISLLNAERPTIAQILTGTISLVFHSNVSAAQGDLVMEVLDKARQEGGYLLLLEGAVPLDMPEACVMGGKPMTELLPGLIKNAKFVVAVGTCASFGGVPAAEGNPTHAASLREFMEKNGLPVANRLVNVAGCPSHSECLTGTIAYLAGKGYPQVDPKLLTPTMFFNQSVHDNCPRFHSWEKRLFAEKFGDQGCLFKLGCLGPLSHTDCPRRQWNGGANWCIRAGAPCTACTSSEFAKKRDFAFYRKGEKHRSVGYSDKDRQGKAS